MKRLFLTGTLVLFILGTAQAETYSVQARVLEQHPDARTLQIAHQGVPGVLEPGPLTVRVGAADLTVDYTGSVVRATLSQAGDQWWLEGIWPADPQQLQIMEDVNRQFRQATAAAGRRAARMQGDFLPNFALFNQEGEVVQMNDFRGSVLVINFIFTRCPDPNMCPASTARMARMQHLINERGWEDVHQVSVTLDPAYDTPGILKYYAESRGIDTEDFSLLTGPKPVMDDVLRTFGILTTTDTGVINHTMATFIVDPNGKIIYRREGTRWSVQEFIDRLDRHYNAQ